jgi:hypothetical protein
MFVTTSPCLYVSRAREREGTGKGGRREWGRKKEWQGLSALYEVERE